MIVDYDKEKETFKAELSEGAYDIDISPNEGEDYENLENSDFLAFRENLNSAGSKSLIAETFGK